MILASKRLLLRPIEPNDIPHLVKLWTDPSVTQYLGGPRDVEFLVKHFEADWLSAAPPKFDQWPVIEKASNRLVGYCGLLDKKVEGQIEIELVFVFCRSVWGKGYATEIAEVLKRHAFERLGLSHLIALIDPQNRPSERVAVKLGMRFAHNTKRPGGKVVKVFRVEAGQPPP
jgi:RimJ/RimL family protein N-acetyltransferase